jgi:hypothetical protein
MTPCEPTEKVVEAGYLCDNMAALADLLFGKANRWARWYPTVAPVRASKK